MNWKPMSTAPTEGFFLVFLAAPMLGSRVHTMRIAADSSGKMRFATIGSLFAFDAPKPLLWAPIQEPTPEEIASAAA